MKISRKILLLVAMAITALIAFNLNNSQAQPPSVSAPPVPTNLPPSQAAPSTAPVPSGPMTASPQARPIGRMPPAAMVFQRSIIFLKQSKTQLERSDSDFGGHKQTAIAACDKAIEELEAAMKAAPPTPKPPSGPQPPPSAQ